MEYDHADDAKAKTQSFSIPQSGADQKEQPDAFENSLRRTSTSTLEELEGLASRMNGNSNVGDVGATTEGAASSKVRNSGLDCTQEESEYKLMSPEIPSSSKGGFERGLSRTQEEREAKLASRISKVSQPKQGATEIQSSSKGGFERGLSRTREEREAKLSSRISQPNGGAPASSKGGFERGLSRTQEEREAKLASRISKVSQPKQGATDMQSSSKGGFERGLSRTREEREAKLSSLISQPNVGMPASSKSGFERGLSRTQEEREAKLASRISYVSQPKRGATDMQSSSKGGFERGLSRTREEREVKLASRISRPNVGAPASSKGGFERGLSRTQEEREAKLASRISKASQPISGTGESPMLHDRTEDIVPPRTMQGHTGGRTLTEQGTTYISVQEEDESAAVDNLIGELQSNSDAPEQGDGISTNLEAPTAGSGTSLETHFGTQEVPSSELPITSVFNGDLANGVPSPTGQPPGAAHISNSDLVEAREVQESSERDLEQAEEVDPALMEREAREQYKNRQCRRTGCVVILVSITFLLSVTFVLSTRDTVYVVPTASPSLVPTEVPSLAPTRALDFLLTNLSEFTLENLNVPLSPQWKAREWLKKHPNITDMELWRQQQLFALATFFHSMEGERWPAYIKDNWMLYHTSECYWHSSEFGTFTTNGLFVGEEVKYTEGVLSYNFTPCNERGEFEGLYLSFLQLEGSHASIPPQISLLTALTVLALTSNVQYETPINITEFLPTQIYQMSSLRVLDLFSHGLTGSIPPDLAGLQLEELKLDGNFLTGSIPTALGLLYNLSTLILGSLTGSIPTELGLLTNMRALQLGTLSISGTLPSELGMMTKLTWLKCDDAQLTGPIPSQFGKMSDLESLQLYNNLLTGPLPTELLSLDQVLELMLFGNSLSGPIPTQVAFLSNLWRFQLSSNLLTSHVPTELGMMEDVYFFDLSNNLLSGPIPTELGKSSSIMYLRLSGNSLSGPLPSQLALMTNLTSLLLNDNSLTGNLPRALDSLLLYDFFDTLVLENNSLSGFISEELCKLGEMHSWYVPGLSFDCSDQLCGCCWCPCPGSSGTCYDPSFDDSEWPGSFPTPVNRSNIIEINVRTDGRPQDIGLELSVLTEDGFWEAVEDPWGPGQGNKLHSYSKEVESNKIYRLLISDMNGDGTCCRHGFGWFSITNATPSVGLANGTVIWEAPGDAFTIWSDMKAFIWVDPAGLSHHIECIPYEIYEQLLFVPERYYYSMVQKESYCLEHPGTVDSDADWPGVFPTPINTPNTITINVRTDEFPVETSIEWGWFDDGSDKWVVLDQMSPANASSLLSYTMTAESEGWYWLRLSDSHGDGTCCGAGLGWFSITNSTPSDHFVNGTVMWNATGDYFGSYLDVYFWVDGFGHVHIDSIENY